MNKKPRKWSINVKFKEPITELGFGILPDGTLQYFDNGVPVKDAKIGLETVYDRSKKKKVINRIEPDPNRISLDPNELLQKFNLIYAIDTNTKVINGNVISVASVIECHLNFSKGEGWYRPIHGLEFWNIKDHPENVAWMKAIKFITNAKGYNSSLTIGIIVDSDLGNLPAYNSRSSPIYSDFYLPENFELIYASAEVGKEEFVVNHLMAMCEDLAKSLLTKISLNEVIYTPQEVSNEPYTHFKLWYVRNHPLGNEK